MCPSISAKSVPLSFVVMKYRIQAQFPMQYEYNLAEYCWSNRILDYNYSTTQQIFQV